MWRNLDLAMWSGNQDEVGGPAVSGWCTHPKLKRSRSTQSTLVARFFAKSGLVAAIVREDRHTDRLCGLVQAPPSPECLRHFVSTPPTDSTPWLSLHPDNARVHTTATAVYFLNETEVLLLPPTPYSPDLSPRDFFLFTEMREQLKGTLFEYWFKLDNTEQCTFLRKHLFQATSRNNTLTNNEMEVRWQFSFRRLQNLINFIMKISVLLNLLCAFIWFQTVKGGGAYTVTLVNQ